MLARLCHYNDFNFEWDGDVNNEESNGDHRFWIINVAERKK